MGLDTMKCKCGSSETKLVLGFLKACKGCGSCPPRYIRDNRSGTTYTVKSVNIKEEEE